MLLVYTHKITPRLTYITKQLFGKILGLEFTLTTKIEEFIKHTGPKITYTTKPLQNEFFIESHALLFETEVRAQEVIVKKWDDLPVFFNTTRSNAMPFDIFAASFYLLTRYEEYLPFKADQHGRFPATSSLAYKHEFLHLPLVDKWARKWLETLKQRFPHVMATPPKVIFTPVVNVTTSHCYAHRGLLRGMSGLLIDLASLRFRRVVERIAVVMKLKPDPFDNFGRLTRILSRHKTSGIFFIQFAYYSKHDKNVSPENNAFKYLIKSVADYAQVALAASFRSQEDVKLLRDEKERLSDVINRPISSVRMRYNKISFPRSYRDLVEAEITDDYSMGYTHYAGFRASTAVPFYFYDLGIEAQQPLCIHPFSFHDYALLGMSRKEKILGEINALASEIRKSGGHFIAVFSNENLGGTHRVNWIELFKKTVEQYHAT